MKLRFRHFCPDIISGRPLAARSLQHKRSCRENSAAGVGPGAGNSDLSGKTALLRTNFWVGGAANLLLSEISFAGAPTSPVGGPAHFLLSEISSLALRHLPPPAAGRCKPEKENQRSSELDADFLFRFAERRRFELLIPFWSIHAFQACLLSHSSISPELPCNTDRSANIRIIC